jgi:hypothetical protein
VLHSRIPNAFFRRVGSSRLSSGNKDSLAILMFTNPRAGRHDEIGGRQLDYAEYNMKVWLIPSEKLDFAGAHGILEYGLMAV